MNNNRICQQELVKYPINKSCDTENTLLWNRREVIYVNKMF
jgi:hypothetical protein